MIMALNIQKKAIFEKSAGTVIGEGSVFENAVLKGGGIVRIDGKFSGTIDIEGHIVIGESGSISGKMCADSALIAGKCHGDIRLRDTLHVTPTAVLSGSVETNNIIVDEGAVFNVACSVLKPQDDTGFAGKRNNAGDEEDKTGA